MGKSPAVDLMLLPKLPTSLLLPQLKLTLMIAHLDTQSVIISLKADSNDKKQYNIPSSCSYPGSVVIANAFHWKLWQALLPFFSWNITGWNTGPKTLVLWNVIKMVHIYFRKPSQLAFWWIQVLFTASIVQNKMRHNGVRFSMSRVQLSYDLKSLLDQCFSALRCVDFNSQNSASWSPHFLNVAGRWNSHILKLSRLMRYSVLDLLEFYAMLLNNVMLLLINVYIPPLWNQPQINILCAK